MFNRFRRWLAPDLAIDLGSASTRVAVEGRGLVLDEPSVVALRRGSRQILGRGAAVGKLARQMLGRTPDSITAVRPIRDGEIADFELCEAMLRHFIQKSLGTTRPRLRPRVVIAVPGDVTSVARRAVFNSVERAGAGQVYLVRKAVAAGIGAGLAIAEPMATMVCDIGGGTTEIAVFSLTETIASRSLRVAGDDMDAAICACLRQQLGLRIGDQTAEQLKLEIGSAAPLDVELSAEVRGQDVVSGVPRKAVVTSQQVRQALAAPLATIVDGLRSALEDCTAEMLGDLVDNGLVLSGGGALLRQLDVYLSGQLNVPVRVADQPRRTVARGTAICIEHLAEWRDSLDGGE
jgi:rod shape-determining protein MreB and related proteins